MIRRIKVGRKSDAAKRVTQHNKKFPYPVKKQIKNASTKGKRK